MDVCLFVVFKRYFSRLTFNFYQTQTHYCLSFYILFSWFLAWKHQVLQLLAGPTSFAPMVEAAIDIVERSGGQYHVLVIIADGQVRVKTYIYIYIIFLYLYNVINLQLCLKRSQEVSIQEFMNLVHKRRKQSTQ